MKRWGKFNTLKERGEWVELQFMAGAASRGYHVLKPWGDSLAYDVGIDDGAGHFLRVQVKSTSYRTGIEYVCKFKPNCHKTHDYTLDEIDLFAAYVIPESVWYLIPASLILGPMRKKSFMLLPVGRPNRHRCKYEPYREAWGLLAKSKSELSRRTKS
jgi:PD-(D/E)XK endonuclease